MHISRFGFTADRAAISRACDEFSRTQCAVLSDFLDPALAWRLAGDIDSEESAPVTHELRDESEFGRDLSFSEKSAVVHALHLLLNNPDLFAAIHEITGCESIHGFVGRAYRNLPLPEYHLDWHDDMADSRRIIGFSLNLTQGAFEGGIFRLRRKSGGEILSEIAHHRPGSAHIFRIDPRFEHCVDRKSTRL